MGKHFDAFGIGPAVEHLERARKPLDVAFVVDPLDVEQAVGQVGRHAVEVGRGTHVVFNATLAGDVPTVCDSTN